MPKCIYFVHLYANKTDIFQRQPLYNAEGLVSHIQSSSNLLTGWRFNESSRTLYGRSERSVTFADVRTGLEVRCGAIGSDDFPTVEWTLYFKNTGTHARYADIIECAGAESSIDAANSHRIPAAPRHRFSRESHLIANYLLRLNVKPTPCFNN
jgi:hypothetical protein